MRTPKTKSYAVEQTKRSFSSPPNPHLDRAGSSGAPGGRGLEPVYDPAPSPSVSLRLCRTSISTHLLSHAAPGGGGLPLPAAAAAAP